MTRINGLALSVIVATSFAAACSSTTTGVATEKGKVSMDAGFFDENKSGEDFWCPPPKPDEFTKRILAVEGRTLEGLHNALERSSSQDQFLLLRGSGDEAGATTVLHKLFRDYGVTCLDFKPAREDLVDRANNYLDGNNSGNSNWSKAFDLFGQLGD